MGYLPDEILTHIFTFLPIKSIIICTSVSKAWKSLIQNPTFISTHLHHSHKNLLLLRLIRDDEEVYTLHSEDDDPDFTEYTRFDSLFHGPHRRLRPHHNAIDSCNGLLCLSDGLSNYANDLFLWNPCVRKLLQVPTPNVTFNTLGLFHTSHGFGFDPKTNDYKVVRIRILTSLGSPDFGRPPPVVEVYSLSTGEWRMLSASAFASLPPICAIPSRAGLPAFANGALHWIAFTNNKKQFVLVFDLGDEVFRQILLPELQNYIGEVMWICVSTYGNSIAGFVLVWSGQFKTNIWVMKEYGVVSSWTKVSHQCPDVGMEYPGPVGFRRNGEFILQNNRRRLVSWNPDTQKIKDIEINGHLDTFLGSYVESLVLLDKATNGVVTY